MTLTLTYSLPIAIAFVSPAFFAAGLGLMSVPVIIHILNRRRFKVVRWAAMDFLLRAMKKNRRRLRFEQLLLLLLRCLVLLLVGIALARPRPEKSGIGEIAGQRSGLHVFVIDNSYSMAYEADRPGAKTHLDQAKLIAKAMIGKLAAGGESVMLITSSKPAQTVMALPTYDLLDAAAAVDRIEQSYGGDDVAGALGKAVEIARADVRQPTHSLYLLDDSTRVAWETGGDALKETGHDIADVFKAGVTHFNLSRPNEWNDAVAAVSPTTSLVTNWFPVDIVSRVTAFGPVASNPKLVWKLDDVTMPGSGAAVSATDQGTPQTLRITNAKSGIHVISAMLQGDDRLKIDDARRRVVDVVGQLKLLIVEGERGTTGMGSSGAFLELALNPPPSAGDTSRKADSHIATEKISDLDLPARQLTDYRCIALCGVGQISEDTAIQLEHYVRGGGTLMVFMGDPVSPQIYNATLLKHHLLPGPLIKRITVAGAQKARKFAFNPHGLIHPMLADFQNREDSGLEAAEIFSYWQADVPPGSGISHVLDFAPADDAKDAPPDPAITLQALGDGSVVFFATAADPNSEWTTLMAHPAYISLMQDMVLGSVSGGDRWMNLEVGQPVVAPEFVPLSSAPTLKDEAQIDYPMIAVTISADAALPSAGSPGAGSPGASSGPNAATRATAGAPASNVTYQSPPLNKPGIYTLSTRTASYKIAVNVPPGEADVRATDDAGIKKALGDISVQFEGDDVPADRTSSDQNKELGWAIMIGVLLLLGVESLLAMWFGHHRHLRRGAAASTPAAVSI